MIGDPIVVTSSATPYDLYMDDRLHIQCTVDDEDMTFQVFLGECGIPGLADALAKVFSGADVHRVEHGWYITIPVPVLGSPDQTAIAKKNAILEALPSRSLGDPTEYAKNREAQREKYRTAARRRWRQV